MKPFCKLFNKNKNDRVNLNDLNVSPTLDCDCCTKVCERIKQLEEEVFSYEIEFPFHLNDTVYRFINNKYIPVIVTTDNYFELRDLYDVGEIRKRAAESNDL